MLSLYISYLVILQRSGSTKQYLQDQRWKRNKSSIVKELCDLPVKYQNSLGLSRLQLSCSYITKKEKIITIALPNALTWL